MNTAHALEFGTADFFGDYIGMAVVGKRAFPLYSVATSIDENPGGPTGWSEAYTNMIVFGDVPAYTDFTVVEGTLLSDEDIGLLSSSNNQRLIVKDTLLSGGGGGGQPLLTVVDVQLDTDFTDVDHDDVIDIRFEGFAEEPDVTGRIYLKSQPASTGEWVLWSQFSVPVGADGNHWNRGIPAIRLLGPGQWDFVADDGRIDVRIEMTRPVSSPSDTLTSQYDFVQLVVVDN